MTTTFHFETNEPQYEYSYEGADVQLRYEGLVAVAAGPAPAFDEKSPERGSSSLRSAGSEYWQGLGEVCRAPPLHRRSKRERQCGRIPWRALRHSNSPKRVLLLLTVSMSGSTQPMDVLNWGEQAKEQQRRFRR